MEYEVRDTVASDLLPLVRVMRHDDVEECFALGFDPLSMLRDCLAHSALSKVAMVGDEPVAIGGVMAMGTLAGHKGIPWLLSGRLADASPIEFVRVSRKFVRLISGMYPTLENFVDLRYTRCHRWLRAIGFTMGETVPHGPYGMPFVRFSLERS